MDYVIPRERDGSLSTTTVERHDDDGSIRFVPLVAGNTDADAYRAWVAAGNAAIPADPAPQAPPTLTFLQFMALFTPAEQATIVASSDPQVRLFTLMASGAGAIDLADAQVVAGVNFLASKDIVASARVQSILAGVRPV